MTAPTGDGPAPAGETATTVPGSEALLRARQEIERVDREIVELLAERVQLALQVGRAKREAGLPLLDPAREAAVVRRAGGLARDAGVSDEDVREIFWHVIAMSRRAQSSAE
jgi:prephenate dehydrogenase